MICIDNLESSSLQNLEHIRDDRLHVPLPRRDRPHRDRGAGRPRVPPGGAGQPDRLPAPAAALAQDRGRTGRTTRSAWRSGSVPGSCSPRRARSTATRRCIRSPRRTGATSTRSGPRGVYDEAKRYAEAMTMAYHRQQGVDTAIVRIFNTYGPRMRPYDGRAIPTFMRQALEHKPLTVFGDGSADAELLLRRRPDSRPLSPRHERGAHARQPGEPGEFTILELAETVIRVTELEERNRLRGLARRRSARSVSQTSRAQRRFSAGTPEIELEEGLRRMLPSLGREPDSCLNASRWSWS